MAWSAGTNLGTVLEGNNAVLTVGASAPAGSLVPVITYENASSNDPGTGGTLADSQGNTWTKRGTKAPNNNSATGVAIYWDSVLTTGLTSGVDTITYTASDPSNLSYLTAAMWTGNAASPLDVNQTPTSGNSASPTISITPLTAGDLIVGIAVTTTDATGSTQPSGFATPPNTIFDILGSLVGGSLIDATTAAKTYNPGSFPNNVWCAFAVAYKVGAASAAATHFLSLMGVGQ